MMGYTPLVAVAAGRQRRASVRQKYQVILTADQRTELQQLMTKGHAPTRTLTHARVLLKADEAAGGPAWTNVAIAQALEISDLTVTRTRKRFIEGGLEAALHRKVQAKRKAPKLDGDQEAHLIALACSEAPTGRNRWSLRLLAGKMVELGHVDDLSHETVRQVLKRGS
jgi:transposase